MDSKWTAERSRLRDRESSGVSHEPRSRVSLFDWVTWLHKSTKSRRRPDVSEESIVSTSCGVSRPFVIRKVFITEYLRKAVGVSSPVLFLGVKRLLFGLRGLSALWNGFQGVVYVPVLVSFGVHTPAPGQK